MALTGAVAAAVVALAVLGARGDADTTLVFAPSSLAPFEAELDAALIESGIGPVEWVFAGSQSLVAQLIDGAPPQHSRFQEHQGIRIDHNGLTAINRHGQPVISLAITTKPRAHQNRCNAVITKRIFK